MTAPMARRRNDVISHGRLGAATMALRLGPYSRASAAHDEAPASRGARPRRARAPLVAHRRVAAAPGVRARAAPTREWRQGAGKASPSRVSRDRTSSPYSQGLRRMSGRSCHGAGLFDVVAPRTRFAQKQSAGGRSTQLTKIVDLLSLKRNPA
jgi:hypothetical protein